MILITHRRAPNVRRSRGAKHFTSRNQPTRHPPLKSKAIVRPNCEVRQTHKVMKIQAYPKDRRPILTHSASHWTRSQKSLEVMHQAQ